MKAYLFQYDNFLNPRETIYTLVHAHTIEEAYKKINDILNPTAQQVEIRLANYHYENIKLWYKS